MTPSLRLMCVLAHPDDESLGMGGTLARYAREGVQTHVVTATRGERGRVGESRGVLPLEQVARIRQAELLQATAVLGVNEVRFLDYRDGELDQADPTQAIARIAAHLRRVRPQVVLTFGPEGAYGHPDHIAISQFTTAAVVCAADSQYQIPGSTAASHRVSKLYYLAWRQDKWTAYQTALKKLTVKLDGQERQAIPWPDWAVTTLIDTSEFSSAVWKAVCCHQSQMSIYSRLAELPEEHHRALWGSQQFYRAFSVVNGGRRTETDLFEGLRGESQPANNSSGQSSNSQ
jgi:LmbE family N-acetylglucosaminyl deacetylase